ncbi:hypothetical protein [Clostridium sp. HBUAS56017]|uniref:hypothetical protein n=1 Tax=Clostridium sp. HBUAS56017 TaxID=2571128 RepID=UPI00163D7B07|nr:hypothetical protein [Clostridium sp. HBUAS56017]
MKNLSSINITISSIVFVICYFALSLGLIKSVIVDMLVYIILSVIIKKIIKQ